MTETRFSFPSTSSVVKMKISPYDKVIFLFLKVLIRYSGPFVSSMMAIGSFSFSLTFLMSLFFARCSSCVPCQKFNRATFIPFLHICVRISSSSQAGAMVQIILVFRIFQNTFLYYNSKADTLCGGHTASDCLREIK